MSSILTGHKEHARRAVEKHRGFQAGSILRSM